MRNPIKTTGIVIVITTIVVLFVIASSHSQNKPKPTVGVKNNDNQLPEDKIKLEKEKADALEQLLGNARVTQPEIFDYVIFQLLESGVIDDKKKKAELIEEVFNSAYSTQHPLKLKDFNDDTDTRSGMLQYGLGLNLDRLSIQCRAVREMIAIDKQKAREMFRDILIPEMKSLKCEDPMIPDVSIYYDTLIAITGRTFSEDEVKKREHVILTEQALSGIASPLQLAPATKVIASIKAQPADISSLLGIFSKRMNDMSCDPRPFLWVLRTLDSDIKTLAIYCKGKGIPVDYLIDSYRTFLAGNMSKNWCDDYPDKSKVIAKVTKQSESFNSLLNEIIGENGKILPLQAKELMPKSFSGSLQTFSYERSATVRNLYKGIRSLNYTENGKQRSVTEREGKLWQSELSKFYNSLSSWAKGDGLSDIDHFHQKISLMGFLLQITPKTDPQYQNILSDYMSLLSQDRSQQENAVEWLWEALIPFSRMEYIKQSHEDILQIYLESPSVSLQTLAKTKLYLKKYKDSAEKSTISKP